MKLYLVYQPIDDTFYGLFDDYEKALEVAKGHYADVEVYNLDHYTRDKWGEIKPEKSFYSREGE